MADMSPTQPEQPTCSPDELASGSSRVNDSVGSSAHGSGQHEGFTVPGSPEASNQIEEQDSGRDHYVIELISENCMLADLTDTLRDRIAELEAALDAQEEQHHREVDALQNEKTSLEKSLITMRRTAAEGQITNRGLEIDIEGYKNHINRLQACNSDLEAEKSTLHRQIKQVDRENGVLTEQNSTLHTENTRLKGTNSTLQAAKNILSTDNKKLQRKNKASNKRVRQLNNIHADLLPLVRDQYAISLRTLVDGVLHLAGWTGPPVLREDFIWDNEPQMLAMFGNGFSVQEIIDSVRYINDAGNVHAHMASGGAIATAIAHFTGPPVADDFLKAAFALPMIFRCQPGDYQPPLPGWEKFLSVYNRRLTIQSHEVALAGFTLKRKRADSASEPDSDLEDSTNSQAVP